MNQRLPLILGALLFISIAVNFNLLTAWLDERGEPSACEALVDARQLIEEREPPKPDYTAPAPYAEGEWDGYRRASTQFDLAFFISYECNTPEPTTMNSRATAIVRPGRAAGNRTAMNTL